MLGAPGPPPDVPIVGGGQGQLQAIVWPPYIGLSSSDPGLGPTALGEPFEDPYYARGTIKWRREPDGEVVGGAIVRVPKGIYRFIVFFSGPRREHPLMLPVNPMEHPMVFDRPGDVEIDPINNLGYLQRRMQ